ncbi:MAG: DUF420 domain-containing protein [Pirellulaceae bacterium]|nr:DUF420 domain-containing protein [Pirellulaceae bacterium]
MKISLLLGAPILAFFVSPTKTDAKKINAKPILKTLYSGTDETKNPPPPSEINHNRGLLPTRGTWIMDTIVVAMAAMLGAILFGICLARKGRHSLHKKVQLTVSVILLIAIILFELDIRLSNPSWETLSALSPYYETGWVYTSLYIHLFFAIPTPFIWAFTITQALRKFPNPPAPNSYSSTHKIYAYLSTIGLFGTTITGWVFYYLAFIA